MLHPQLSSKHQKGFTLIEIAIVLVIIGLLVGGVLAGKDLMTNARAKSLAAWARGWEQSLYAHLDRTGRLPDDGNANGLMGSPDSETPRSSLHDSTLEDVPPATEQFGSVQLTLLLGNGGSHAQLNVLALVATETLGTAAFGQKPLPLLQSLDTIIDGSVDPQFGLFRGYTSIETTNSETVTALSSPAATYDEAVAAAYFFDGAPNSILYTTHFTNAEDFLNANPADGGSWDSDESIISSNYGYITFGPDDLSDFTMTTSLTIEDGKAGILYRTGDHTKDWRPTSGYGLQIEPNWKGGSFVLKGFTSDADNALAEAPFPDDFEPTGDHSIKIQVNGDTHNVYVDNNPDPVLSYDGSDTDDPDYTSGQVGLRAWGNDKISVDEVTVTPE